LQGGAFRPRRFDSGPSGGRSPNPCRRRGLLSRVPADSGVISSRTPHAGREGG